jgi:alcohol dehydrogenase, propanol-preferring
MRAAVLKEPKGRLHIEDRALPKPGHGEVLIRVRACGVCHGDLMVCNGDFPLCGHPSFRATKSQVSSRSSVPA